MLDSDRFCGGVFSDAIDGGRASAEIELSRTGLSARTVEGDSFVLPYHECHLEVGGFSGHMVFCRNADRSLTIFCEDRKFPSALSHASAGLLDEQLSARRRERRSANWRARRFTLAAVVGLVLLMVAGYFGIRAGARAAVHALPPSVDRQIGTAAFKAMDLGGPEIEDAQVTGAMRAIVERLAPHAALADMDFDIHVVDAPTVNAFCLPGGTVVVFTGLLKQAESPEQVAGVLAHEMAHATLRHGLERISQSLGVWAAVELLLGDVGGLIAAGGELLRVASVNSYSRAQEDEADAEGVRMLHAAGIDPSGLTQFFESLKHHHGDVPGVISWISTHPQHDERIRKIEMQMASLPAQEYTPLELDWAAVQRQLNQP